MCLVALAEFDVKIARITRCTVKLRKTELSIAELGNAPIYAPIGADSTYDCATSAIYLNVFKIGERLITIRTLSVVHSENGEGETRKGTLFVHFEHENRATF